MNPWPIIWVISLVAMGFWQNSAGHTSERTIWQAKSLAELANDNKAIHDSEEKYRAAEQHSAELLAAVSTTYEDKLRNANQKTAVLIAAARSGSFRLRDPGSVARPSRGGLAAETSAGASGRDDAGDGGLSTGTAEFLLGLTGRCNNTRDQLTACQAVVLADRVTCNGS